MLRTWALWDLENLFRLQLAIVLLVVNLSITSPLHYSQFGICYPFKCPCIVNVSAWYGLIRMCQIKWQKEHKGYFVGVLCTKSHWKGWNIPHDESKRKTLLVTFLVDGMCFENSYMGLVLFSKQTWDFFKSVLPIMANKYHQSFFLLLHWQHVKSWFLQSFNG